MTISRGTAAAVRIVVLVAFYLVFLLVLSRSESTDPLGAGLLFFLIAVLAAFVWAVVDGSRRGLAGALVVWLVTAVGTSVAWSIILAISDGVGLGEELLTGVTFFVPLLFVPAGLGSVIGELVRRRRTPSVDR